MKVIQVKRVPKGATKVVVSGRIRFRLQNASFLFVYEPYVNCYGEHVFVRYTYNIKPKNLAK